MCLGAYHREYCGPLHADIAPGMRINLIPCEDIESRLPGICVSLLLKIEKNIQPPFCLAEIG